MGMQEAVKVAVLGLVISGASSFALAGRSYVCSEQTGTSQFLVNAAENSGDTFKVEILKISKTPQVLAADLVALQDRAEKLATYSNNVPDSTIEMTISDPDVDGKRSTTLHYTTKKEVIRIPEKGNLLCELLPE